MTTIPLTVQLDDHHRPELWAETERIAGEDEVVNLVPMVFDEAGPTFDFLVADGPHARRRFSIDFGRTKTGPKDWAIEATTLTLADRWVPLWAQVWTFKVGVGWSGPQRWAELILISIAAEPNLRFVADRKLLYAAAQREVACGIQTT